jgi:hypothetical protein
VLWRQKVLVKWWHRLVFAKRLVPTFPLKVQQADECGTIRS